VQFVIRLLLGAVSGRYPLLGDPTDADCVVGHAFGTRTDGPGRVNELLARFLVERVDPRLPWLLQGEIADALPPSAPAPALVVRGELSTSLGNQVDSWAVFERVRPFLAERGLSRPLLVAQAFHVGRVAREAERQGLRPVVPAGLPRRFDRASTQRWTRNVALWVSREIPALAYLAFQREV
jgi:hypothetical protein